MNTNKTKVKTYSCTGSNYRSRAKRVSDPKLGERVRYFNEDETAGVVEALCNLMQSELAGSAKGKSVVSIDETSVELNYENGVTLRVAFEYK